MFIFTLMLGERSTNIEQSPRPMEVETGLNSSVTTDRVHAGRGRRLQNHIFEAKFAHLLSQIH